MKNYRVTFLKNQPCDYWNKNKRKLQAEAFPDFHEWHEKYYPIIRNIKSRARKLGIEYIWHFYEPYVEITWYADEQQSERLFGYIGALLHEGGIKDLEKFYPKDGEFADWFCHGPEEREFGGKVHSLCSQYAELDFQYCSSIASGKGRVEQVKRTIHRLCNPLGLNYKDEARICFSRGLICWLFTFLSFKKAVWVYTKIFRQKY